MPEIDLMKEKTKEYLKKPEYEGFLPFFVDRVTKISSHVYLSYDETLNEIDNMNIPIQIELAAEDDIELNCTIIDMIQGYKDRLTALYCKAERDYELIEGNYQSLVKMWCGLFSQLSSDKKREGEAEMLFGFLDPERKKRAEVFSTIKQHLKNMSDKFFSISRKAAIHEHVYRLVGTGYIDQPDAFERSLRERRKNMNNKMNKLRNKIASGAKGWDIIPSSNEE
jgi:hypothetical protein